MDVGQILAIYDRVVRLQPAAPAGRYRRECVGSVFRDVGPSPASHENGIAYSRLDPCEADAAIREQIAYFEGIGHAFEWKVYGHDPPPDLKARLLRYGFEAEEEEALVVLDLSEASVAATTPAGVQIRRLTDPTALQDVIAVQNRVWGSDHTWLDEALAEELRRDPDSLSIQVAYCRDEPICTAWVRLPQGTQFASLWGGSTLPEHRGRGIYRAMVAIRAEEARRRGARFLTVDAGPMSRPILERLGFRLLTTTTPCVWCIRPREG
jgi:GNAT superfamily N-acetyltransferase